ncbi:MAG TPA: hypothetical protein VFB84_08430 [Micromonosporaceae bacterium]|nr:hypothetical protein [Micromonosporaceae bacterium]
MSAESRSRGRSASRLSSRGDAVPNLLEKQLEQAEHLLSVDDPVEAELHVAGMISLAKFGGLGSELNDMLFLALVKAASENPSPHAATLLRTVVAIGSPSQRRVASNALGIVTAAGHFPPEWTVQLGRAVPERAWRRFDVFGDAEIITVTFRYGDAEHVVVVQVDRCREPVALNIIVTGAVADVLSHIQSDDDPLMRVEPLDLDDVRHRIEPALARCDQGGSAELSGPSLVCLPVARARVRRLPAGGQPPELRSFTAADRDAAVADFLAGAHAADAGEEKTARFWGEVLTGYSGYVPGEAPTRVGPRKVSEMLLSYVPNTFTLTGAQRDGMSSAVTAWARWSAERQELDKPATAHLEEHLPKVFAEFDEAYDHPDSILVRSYLTDISTVTADATVLGFALHRRHLAVPVPEARTGADHIRLLDAADPTNRRAIVESECGECELPAGMTRAQFLDAAVRVVEQLWHDDPPEIWQEAQRLSAAGLANHDVIHRLVAGARSGG